MKRMPVLSELYSGVHTSPVTSAGVPVKPSLALTMQVAPEARVWTLEATERVASSLFPAAGRVSRA